MKMLRTTRKAKGLTMKELGARVGVSESAISQYETGKREADYDTISKISEILECSIDYLLRGEDTESEYDHYTALIKTYGDAVVKWSEGNFFTADETTVIRMHFSELLLRYKQLIESASKNKMDLKKYLKAIASFNSESDNPLSQDELIAQYWSQNLKHELDDLKGWIDSFPLHLSQTMAHEDIAGELSSDERMHEVEKWEVEEYRSRLLSAQPQPGQQKKPIPVSGDELDEMFMRYVQELTPDQQLMILEQMQRMTGQQKEPSPVFAQQITDEKAP